jgi:hypothetical protein
MFARVRSKKAKKRHFQRVERVFVTKCTDQKRTLTRCAVFWKKSDKRQFFDSQKHLLLDVFKPFHFMIKQTTFILPQGVELSVRGSIPVHQGHKIHIDHPDFGEEVRTVDEVCITCKIVRGVLQPTMRVFLT